MTIHDVYKIYSYVSATTGKTHWSYKPIDFDDSFESWSYSYPTREEAEAAALAELPALIGDKTTDVE